MSFFAVFALGREPSVEVAKPAQPPANAAAPILMHPFIPTGPFPTPSPHPDDPVPAMAKEDKPVKEEKPAKADVAPSAESESVAKVHARPTSGSGEGPSSAGVRRTPQGHEATPTVYQVTTRDGYTWRHTDPDYLRRWAIQHDSEYRPVAWTMPTWNYPGTACVGGRCGR